MGGSSGHISRGNISKLEEKAKSVLEGSAQGKRNVFISFSHADMDDVNLLSVHPRKEC